MSDESNTETESTQEDRLWATLSYIFSPIVPIGLLLFEKKRSRPFIKAHLAQALVFGTIVWVLIAIMPRGLLERIAAATAPCPISFDSVMSEVAVTFNELGTSKYFGSIKIGLPSESV